MIFIQYAEARATRGVAGRGGGARQGRAGFVRTCRRLGPHTPRAACLENKLEPDARLSLLIVCTGTHHDDSASLASLFSFAPFSWFYHLYSFKSNQEIGLIFLFGVGFFPPRANSFILLGLFLALYLLPASVQVHRVDM